MKNLNYKILEDVIGIKFNDHKILKKSLTHKSYSKNDNNEKLEFLGDRVLGLIVSERLLEIFPEEKEGIIDKKYANMVNKKTCAEISKFINLKNFMLIGESNKILDRSDDKIQSDCLEALIGAIYLDQGFKQTKKFIFNFWKKYFDNSHNIKIDAKTKLQEYTLKKYKVLPKYSLEKKYGPHHSPNFKIVVQIPNSKKYFGVGKSKQDAEQLAAQKLLQSLV